jgi:hypothetical protein
LIVCRGFTGHGVTGHTAVEKVKNCIRRGKSIDWTVVSHISDWTIVSHLSDWTIVSHLSGHIDELSAAVNCALIFDRTFLPLVRRPLFQRTPNERRMIPQHACSLYLAIGYIGVLVVTLPNLLKEVENCHSIIFALLSLIVVAASSNWRL